jgi:POT family proton-dependent oligopeptide transporter
MAYPKSLPYIIANEAAERFSFYGMRSILTTFLVLQFFNPTLNPGMQAVAEAQANEATHFFVSLAYAVPFLGAIAADWFFGKYRVIFWISILYCVGHLLLSLFDTNLEMFRFGLILIAIGAGGIKSCVSANVGDQFNAENKHLLSKVYSWFYFAINAGSAISTLVIPLVYAAYGPKWAFGVPGILMAISTVIFYLGRNTYVRLPASGIKKDNFVFISVYALTHFHKRQKGESLLDVAKAKFNPEKVEDIKAAYRVIAVFSFIPIFWAMWDQNLSEWILQAVKLDRHVFGYELLPQQTQTVNPFFLLLLIPVYNYVIYPFFDRLGIKTTPLRRIGGGLVLMALTFVIIALVQTEVDKGLHPTIWWHILAYFMLAAAEVMVSVTCLEYAYTQAPPSMKSTMGAVWLLTIAVGNVFTALVNRSISTNGFFASLTGASYYWFFIGLMTAIILIFLVVSPRIKEKSYVH